MCHCPYMSINRNVWLCHSATQWCLSRTTYPVVILLSSDRQTVIMPGYSRVVTTAVPSTALLSLAYGFTMCHFSKCYPLFHKTECRGAGQQPHTSVPYVPTLHQQSGPVTGLYCRSLALLAQQNCLRMHFSGYVSLLQHMWLHRQWNNLEWH